MSRSRGERCVTSRSPIVIRPPVTSSRPAIIRSSVDLPQPDGPTSTRNSPLSIVRSTSSTARTPPLNSFVTCSSADLRHAVSLLMLDLTARPIIWQSRRCCKRSLKSFSEILCRSSEPTTPTLTTVARLANVSVASASRVLNGIKTNPETLAARVARRPRRSATSRTPPPAASARAARARSRSRCRTSRTPSTRRWSASIQQVARASGSRLILHSTERRRRRRARRSSRDLQAALRRRADPLSRCEFTDAHARRSTGAAVPVVVIGKPHEGRAGRHRARELAPRRRGGRAPPARRRPPADRVRQRARAHGARDRRASSATSTGCARCGLERDDALDRGRRRLHDRRRAARPSSACSPATTPGRDLLRERPARARRAERAARRGPRRAARRRARRHGQHEPLAPSPGRP